MDEIVKKVLTGNYYFKPTISGLVLMVEVRYDYFDIPRENKKTDEVEKVSKPKSKQTIKEFVKASVSDAFELKLCAIPIV